MMLKKEYYRGNLPHFQQPGQWYFITFVLYNAVPKLALKNYSEKLRTALFKYRNMLNNNIDPIEILKYKREYFNLRKSYFFQLEKLLDKPINSQITLNNEKNRKIIEDALEFWENKRLQSHAWCIMPNHLHWIVSIFKMNEKREPVYLQDVLHSIKSYTSHQINIIEGNTGQFWMHESFDTTIRNENHFHYALDYTLNNPVKAGLVKNWMDWPGTFVEKGLI
jgi:putative transposase